MTDTDNEPDILPDPPRYQILKRHPNGDRWAFTAQGALWGEDELNDMRTLLERNGYAVMIIRADK